MNTRKKSNILNPGFKIFEQLGFPNPKFQIGDRIKHSFICDDKLDLDNYCKLVTLYGIVLWMIPDTKNRRWEYCILWDGQKPESCDFFPCSSPDFDWEDHLKLA